MKKKLLLVLLALVLMGSLSIPDTVTAAPKPIKLKMCSFVPAKFIPSVTTNWYCEEITRRTNGRVQWDMYWGGSLLKGDQLLAGISKGICDFASYISLGYTPKAMPLYWAGMQLFVTDKIDAVQRAMSELIEEDTRLRKEMKDNNVKHLHVGIVCNMWSGFKKPVTTVEDVRGMAIRTYGQAAEAFQLLGANPTAIGATETYGAIQRGVISGYTGLPFDIIPLFKLEEVAKYFVDIGAGQYAACPAVFNLDSWNKLPSDIQKVFKEVSLEYPKKFMYFQERLDRVALDTLVKAGVIISQLSPKEMRRWKDICTPKIWDDWIERTARTKGMSPSEVRTFLNLFIERVRKYESQSIYKHPYDIYKEKYGK